MLDNPELTAYLLGALEDALPLDARIGPRLAAALEAEHPWITPLQPCRILEVHYAGDEGGIVCFLDLGAEAADSAFVVSITHLAFDRREPLARLIAGYQKRRTKRIRREAAQVRAAMEMI